MAVSGIDDDTRKAMVGAIASGRLTVAEVSAYLDVHREQIWRWLRAEKIDPKAARLLYIARTLRLVVTARPPSKRTLRARAHRAQEAWANKHKVKLD